MRMTREEEEELWLADKLVPSPGEGSSAPHSGLALWCSWAPSARDQAPFLLPFVDGERSDTLGGTLVTGRAGHGSSGGRPPQGGGQVWVPCPTFAWPAGGLVPVLPEAHTSPPCPSRG